jgi:plastocyanin
MPAPALSSKRRVGALLMGACLLAACDRTALPGGGPQLELEDASVRLPRGASIHSVELGVAEGGFAPARIEAKPGDAVRFTVTDAMLHDVAFEDGQLAAEATAFLDRTAQLRSPPLVSRGATWVVSLDDAPPGRYPFVCTAHQERGELLVQP